MYPVGKTQLMVLNALGLQAGTFGYAEQLFAELGIVVSAKRVGRTTVPVIRIKNDRGGWNAGGDGHDGSAHPLTAEQREAIAQWISE